MTTATYKDHKVEVEKDPRPGLCGSIGPTGGVMDAFSSTGEGWIIICRHSFFQWKTVAGAEKDRDWFGIINTNIDHFRPLSCTLFHEFLHVLYRTSSKPNFSPLPLLSWRLVTVQCPHILMKMVEMRSVGSMGATRWVNRIMQLHSIIPSVLYFMHSVWLHFS